MKHRSIHELLADAACAIRDRDGSTEPIRSDDIPDRIRGLPVDLAETYEGAYEAEPRTVSQSFATKDRKMSEDFTVKEIYFSETSNLFGGTTVYIGKE